MRTKKTALGFQSRPCFLIILKKLRRAQQDKNYLRKEELTNNSLMNFQPVILIPPGPWSVVGVGLVIGIEIRVIGIMIMAIVMTIILMMVIATMVHGFSHHVFIICNHTIISVAFAFFFIRFHFRLHGTAINVWTAHFTSVLPVLFRI